MTADEYTRLVDLVEAALQQPPSAREAFLRAAVDGERALFDEAMRLLRAAERDNGPIDDNGFGLLVRGVALSALDAPRIEAALDQVGPYTIITCIGESIFARVYLAKQSSPIHRQVAVKVIREDVQAEAVLARFDLERQALARMRHPNVASIYDAGSLPDGRPWFVMEYVPGPSITEYARGHKLDDEGRIRLMIDVSGAVQHAHQNGVIHRDLKPSNVRVTERDGRPVVKVIDFGVARAITTPLTDKAVQTVEGQIIGTFGYMSPEQITGAHVDTRSDVYALGVLLYELLAERPAFEVSGRSFAELVRRTTDAPTPELRRPDGRLPADLRVIAAKAMAREPGRRYQSAGELGADLERFLRHDAIAARPPTVAYTLRTLARRHRVWAAASGVTLATLIAALVVVSAVLRETERQREVARQTVQVLLGDAIDRLTPQSGTADERREVLTQLVHQARAFADGFAGDSDALRVYAKVLHALGNLEVEEGRIDEAEGYRREELDIVKSLSAAAPDDADLRADVSVAIVKIGDLAKARGDWDSAFPLYVQAFELDEVLAAEFPDSRRILDQLCWSYARMGAALCNVGRSDEAPTYWQRGRLLIQPVLDANPDDVVALRHLYDFHMMFTDLAFRHGDTTQHQSYALEGLTLARRLVELDPTNRFDRRRLARVLRTLAFSAVEDAAAGTTRLLDESVAILEELSAADPQDADTNYVLAGALYNRAYRWSKSGELERAQADAERAVQVANRLADPGGGDLAGRRILGYCHNALANVAHLRGDAESAREHLQRAIDLLRSLSDLPGGSQADTLHFARLLLWAPVPEMRSPAESRRRLEALVARVSPNPDAGVPEMLVGVDPVVQRTLAQAWYETGDADLAIRALERLLQTLPPQESLFGVVEQELMRYRGDATAPDDGSDDP